MNPFKPVKIQSNHNNHPGQYIVVPLRKRIAFALTKAVTDKKAKKNKD